MESSNQPNTASTVEIAHPIRRWIITILCVVVLAVAAVLYLRYQRNYPSTSDAYVHGNIIYVAAQVGGQIASMNVSNYQTVDSGELLLTIEPSFYQAQLNKAKANYVAAVETHKAKGEAVIAASDTITTAAANLHKIQLNYRRITTLVKEGVMPKAQGDDVTASLVSAHDALKQARANMAKLVAEQGGSSDPSVEAAAAELMLATINLSYTNVSAPESGTLGRLNVFKGSVITANQALFPLVVANSYWVEANFKESDIQRMQVGQSAEMQFDMSGTRQYKGVIDAISPATGSAFSILPPENASGNWVKIPQRFPISIRFSNLDEVSREHSPRVGASASVTINTVVPDHG